MRTLITILVVSTLFPIVGTTAETDEHWAFTAPAHVNVPDVQGGDWVRSPIDAFVLERLVKEGLQPTAEADRPTLIRRLHLDLTGLPPTLASLEEAMADTGSDWYETLVERLLASPHYGEHWARHWLDAAQYADSDGFEKDKPRQVWKWRDWVIDAFNRDKPYNDFVVEQIAGDMMPGAGQAERIATGFFRNSMINEEGGIDPEQFRMEALFNRMDLLGRAVLGLTVQCAQCHTHKYDPLTHSEYFEMMSMLNNNHEAVMVTYSEAELAQREQLLSMITTLEDGIKEEHSHWESLLQDWMTKAKKEVEPEWEVLEFEFDDSSLGGQKFTPQEDGSYLAEGYAPTRFSPKMTTTSTLPEITAVKLDLLTDQNLPGGGPGRSIYGTCALSEFEFRVTKAADLEIATFESWDAVKIKSTIADVNPPQRPLGPEYPAQGVDNRSTGPVALAIDGNNDTAWTTDIDPGRRNQTRYAVFTLEEPLKLEAGMRIAIRLAQNHGGNNSNDGQTNNLGRFRISVTGDKRLPKQALPENIKQLLAKSEHTEAELAALFSYWHSVDDTFSVVNNRIDGLWLGHPVGVTQLVLAERNSLRITHRLERGDFLSPAEGVTSDVPSFLHAMDDGIPRNRLGLAQWLTSRESPTTARAYVNRVWQRYFGEGLVKTTADFGVQGDLPSHPALLDWLAVAFMDSGWAVKDLHRQIVLSSTYKQSSQVSPALLEADPENRLLARGARFRVEGEGVRDIALTASGLLNGDVGGRSVYPPAPEFIFKAPASYGDKTWTFEQGDDKYRRGLYTFRFRSVPYPPLQIFDTPAGDAPCTRRERSNSPLQALTLLNESLYFESAVALAKHTLAEGGNDDRARLDYAFKRCVSRAPESVELDSLMAFLEAQRTRLAEDALDAKAILPGEEDDKEMAAWALTARVLLNLDETIVRQ